MRIIKLLFSILAIPFGIFLVVYGELDDSPGGMLLGLAMTVIGIVLLFKHINNRD